MLAGDSVPITVSFGRFARPRFFSLEVSMTYQQGGQSNH